jgi:hypothetical protein
MENSRLIVHVVIKRLTAVCLFCFAMALSSHAQSTNIDFPTPVETNEVRGVIEARDIGDPRLTRHYFLLAATQGDLFLSVESNNLNGDVDLFTAGSLRPLTKLNIFAGLSTTSSSKSVFLRLRESLILRVEARSASDEPGSYRVRFSGGFEPVAASTSDIETSDPKVSDSRGNNRNVRRVNSAGARINLPLPEVASATNPTEDVPPATVEGEKDAPVKNNVTPPPAPAKPKTTKTLRVARNKPPVKPPVKPTENPPAKPAARSTRRKPSTTVKKTEPETVTPPPPSPTTPEPVFNPRLIIETRDGIRIERYMSEVRRVTVEKGQLIVITIDGRIERRAMTSVLRVTIEP